MQNYFSFRTIGIVWVCLITLFGISAASAAPPSSYSSALRRYPYLTDVVGSYATINWATDRSESSGLVRYGKVGSESCTAHTVIPTKAAISVNGVLEYQWKAQLTLDPGTQYCYRVYLGTSPANQIDLLGTDPAPSFWTQVPVGDDQSFSFVVIGDWGYVGSSGTNPSQANLMSLIASSGARFVVTTGDNGYPDGNQKNLGDLVQTGLSISAVFGPSFWKVPGASMPIFPVIGNHGFSSPDANHPHILTWPQDRAVASSGGRYLKETYCCLNGSNSASYPSAWYAFDAGPARFYILETAWDEVNVGTASEYQMDYDYHWAPGSPQWEWLKADLAAHPSVLKFAFIHYPLYSDNPIEAASPYLLGSNGLEGLLKQHSVDIAFTGHAHIYERNLPSASGVPNYITGGGGAPLGTLGTCTSLDAYAIKFTTTGKACGSAPTPTSAAQVYHFLKVTVNGTNVTVTPINSLGQSFDVQNYAFTTGVEGTAPTTPSNLTATAASGRQVNLSWSASSDNTGVRGYSIYRNGALVATVDQDTLTYSDANLAPATSYSYRVDAFDGSGNHSALSTAKTATTQNTATYTFNPVADAYVAGDLTSTNYGRSTTLKADASPDYHSYLRFEVGDVSGTITKATLRLYTTSSTATGYQVKQVNSQTWEEGTINYTNAPAVGATIGSSGSFASARWTTVDVTSLINGNGIYDLAITTTSSTIMNFNSRDAGSNRPELVIETSGAPVTPITPTPSMTATATRTPTRTPTATATTGSGNTLTFTANADARVSQTSPTTNYGTATTLLVDGDAGAAQTAYIRFAASGISGSIQSVKLRVYCTTNGTNNGPAAYLANSTWTESGTGGVTWNTQPALLSGAVDNKGAIAADTWVEYDVTSLVSGNGTYTFALVADGSDGITFSSKEGTAAPQLVITLGTGGPTVTPSHTPTSTPTSPAAATNTPTATRTPTRTPTNPAAATNTPTATPTLTSNAPTNTSTATPTQTVSSPGNTLTFTPVADARVAQAAPTTNYGAQTNLQAGAASGSAQNSYLRFNLSGITGTIQSVKLRVYCTTNATNNGPAVYLADSNWAETGTSGITWNTQPALLSDASDNKGAIGLESWVEYDVTALVTGDGTYTFALVADGADGVTFSSREGTSPPQVVVTFAP